MTTTVNLSQYHATIAKIAKINERAAKRGLAGRLAMVVDPEAGFRTRRVCDHDVRIQCAAFGEFGGHHFEQVVDVEIAGDAPKHEGWTFAARVDRIAGTDSYTLATAPGVDHVSREGLVLGQCDHCNTNRARKTTYVLVSEAGEQVQVGSTCIKDFLGWEGNIAWLDVPAEIDDEWLGTNTHAEQLYDVVTVVRLALASIRMRGFVTTQDYSSQSTRDHVSLVWATYRLSEQDKQALDALLAAAKDVTVEEAQQVLDFLRSDEFAGQSSYVDNLKVIAALEYVGSRQMGLLVSAPQAYAKHLGTVAQRAAKVASEWIGTKGEKITTTVTLERVQTISGHYGTSLLVTGRTDAGEIVKTFTTAQWAWDATEGEVVTLTATVKEHETYEGTKQTSITRAKKVA